MNNGCLLGRVRARTDTQAWRLVLGVGRCVFKTGEAPRLGDRMLRKKMFGPLSGLGSPFGPWKVLSRQVSVARDLGICRLQSPEALWLRCRLD